MDLSFKYETHCHTTEGSSDSRMSAVEMVRYYASKGYAGLVITDHFTGSSAVPPYCNWKERAERFFGGYGPAIEEGKKLDFDVFISLEYSDKGNDFLFYGLGKEFILDNPDARDIRFVDLLKRARDAGGFIIHAHPFSRTTWIPEVRLFPELIDAVEIINGGEERTDNAKANRRAAWFAEEFNFPVTGGSDMHYYDETLWMTGVAAPRRAKNIFDLAEMIKNRQTTVIKPEKMTK